jgi:hypothetical protein
MGEKIRNGRSRGDSERDTGKSGIQGDLKVDVGKCTLGDPGELQKDLWDIQGDLEKVQNDLRKFREI